MTTDQPTPLQSVMLLRAMAAKMERDAKHLLTGHNQNLPRGYLMADIALIAQLLADHVERTEVDYEQ